MEASQAAGEAIRTIVFAIDEKYVKYFSVTLLSLLRCVEPEARYEIIIIGNGLSGKSERALLGMLPKSFSMRFIDGRAVSAETLGDLASKISLERWDISTFFDMLVPLLFSEKERVLFCDADLIFREDPAPLFEIPFDDKLLIAVRDTFSTELRKRPEHFFLLDQQVFLREQLGIADPEQYFNGGVLMFHTGAIDRQWYLGRAKEALSLPSLPTVDQDALNCVFKGRVKLVPLRHNFQYHLLNELTEADRHDPFYQEYLEAASDPAVIHYTTDKKPWLYPDCAMSDAYFEYAAASPFYKKIRREMRAFRRKEDFKRAKRKVKAAIKKLIR